jgi:hypothetical protein
MPFRSEKQRRYLAANKPTIFKEWTKKSGSTIKPKKKPKKKSKKK